MKIGIFITLKPLWHKALHILSIFPKITASSFTIHFVILFNISNYWHLSKATTGITELLNVHYIPLFIRDYLVKIIHIAQIHYSLLLNPNSLKRFSVYAYIQPFSDSMYRFIILLKNSMSSTCFICASNFGYIPGFLSLYSTTL